MTKDRDQMIKDIELEVELTRQFIGKDKLASKVLAAMRAVPRDDFVPLDLKYLAYENRPLAIGLGQTISQPYIVALMTDLLDLHHDDVVLEIGTGSGYQTAILSQLVHQIYSVEVLPELAQAADRRLKVLNYTNIEVHHGDGYLGWPEHAPYDAIIVTAAAPIIPPALVEQLKPESKMVIPVGHSYTPQQLMVVYKDKHNSVELKNILPVSFVPLVNNDLKPDTIEQ